VAEVKFWHKIAAARLRGELWKLSNQSVVTQEMFDGQKDVYTDRLSYVLHTLDREFVNKVSEVLAECEEDAERKREH